jgi:hypothetical protein
VENRPIGPDMQSKRPTVSGIKFDPQLWRHPEKWPHDPLNYIFLARAFQEIGRTRYGDEWTDRHIEPEEPPDDCDEAADEQYDRDCEEAEVKFQNMHVSIARAIAEQSELGNLVTALRHTTGGGMNALDPNFWNTEYLGPRFFRCQMSLDQPFEDPARVKVIAIGSISRARVLISVLAGAMLRSLRQIRRRWASRSKRAALAGNLEQEPGILQTNLCWTRCTV